MFSFFKRRQHEPPKSESPQASNDALSLFAENLKYISACEVSAAAIAGQFVKSQSRYWLTVGTADFPTGKVVVADPLCYLPSGEFSPTLEQTIPSGSYRVDISLFHNDTMGIRICTAKLKLKDTNAIRYVLAESTPDSAAVKNEAGMISGFPVDAGVMCICDEQVGGEFRGFTSKWQRENPCKNLYDDYFSKLFAESFEQLPAYQQEGGDFIEWANPETGRRMVFAASGFGDGFYQSFCGYDSEDALCELIVPLVNPDLFES
jgi:hypothetical protein